MSDAGLIQNALEEFSECFSVGNLVAVPTQHLYPSNGNVTVYIDTVHGESFRVTDNGGAVEELSTLGLETHQPDRLFRSTCSRYGVEVRRGVIQAPRVPINGLGSAIVFVATASSRAVEHGMERLKPARHRNLDGMVQNTLRARYSIDRVRRESAVNGASNRKYLFDFSVQLPSDVRLLLDIVVPEIGSINSKVVSHIDVAKINDPELIQRIVFDDEEDWDTADLSLLQMAATTVPFSRFEDSLNRLVVH